MPIENPCDYWRDLPAAAADLFGLRRWTDDQLHALDILSRVPRVAMKGGNGTGKSFIVGVAGAVYMLTNAGTIYTGAGSGCKSLWTAPTARQVEKLSWGELKAALARWRGKVPPGGKLLETEWQFAVDWYAMAFTTADLAKSDPNAARARAKGFHAENQLAVLDESNDVPDSVHDAIEVTWQGAGARVWYSWNPTSSADRSAQFWQACPEEGRLTFSAEAAVEWQERNGAIPGMATRAWLEDMRRRYYGTTRWCSAVSGEFPDESQEQIVIPLSWLRRCVNLLPQPEDSDYRDRALGVDTGWGGASETVLAPRIGRVVQPLHCYPGLKSVPEATGRAKIALDQIGGRSIAVACVDVLGNAGSGVHDLLRQDGYRSEAVYGGSRPAEVSQDYQDLTTALWFTVRERVRRTVEALDVGNPAGIEISLPDDDELFYQFSTRRWIVKGDKCLALEQKPAMAARGLASPDRADAVAYSFLTALKPSYEPRWT